MIAQPINTVSSLAFVAAGAEILRTTPDHPPLERLAGWSAVAAGIGSIAYHGPGGTASKLIHDAGLLSLLGSIGSADLTRGAQRDVGWKAAALIPVVSVVVARSRGNETAQVVAGAFAGIGEVLRLTSSTHRADMLAAPIATLGALAHVLGRSGGPLCEPESLLQPHAAWHVSMAATVWLRARSVARIAAR